MISRMMILSCLRDEKNSLFFFLMRIYPAYYTLEFLKKIERVR